MTTAPGGSGTPRRPTVAAVIVTRDRADLLRHTLLAFRRLTRPVDALVVVDNASTDGTAAMLAEEFGQVEVVRLPENEGPAGGYAAGMRRAVELGHDWLWLFNDDDHPLPTALERLLDVAAGAPRRTAMVAGWTYDEEGAVRPNGLRWRHRQLPAGPRDTRGPGAVPTEQAPYPVDVLVFAGVLVRAEAVREVGLPRREYFMMCEEMEYCLRARAAGWGIRVLPVPLTVATHAGSTRRAEARTPWREYYQTRNQLLMSRERGSWPELWFWAVRQAKFVTAAALTGPHRRRRIALRLRGARDGLRGITGRTLEPPAAPPAPPPEPPPGGTARPAGGGGRRLRVAMLVMYPDVPWQRDWCRAAAEVADLVEIVPLTRLPPPAPAPAAGRPRPGPAGALGLLGAVRWPGALGRLGAAVRLTGGGPVRRDPTAEHPRYLVRRPHWRPSRLLGRLGDRLTVRRLERVLARAAADGAGPVDLLHGHTRWAAAYLPELSRRSGIPFVVTEHDAAWYDAHPGLPLPTPQSIDATARMFRRAAAVIAVCPPLRDVLQRSGLPARYRVVPNPVDLAALPPVTELPRRRPATGVVTVVSAGRMVPAKGFDVLLRAFAKARTDDPRLRLRLIGDGRERGALQALAGRLGVAEAVDFTGHLPRAELLENLADAELFALASHAENLTVTVLEALCCGVPAVTTAVGGLPALVAESGAGAVVPPGDPDALAAALRTAAAEAPLVDRRALATATRARYGLPAVARRLERVYREAVD
ncbi:glycosyltransferase [Allostreptomyces psammosilenae]|uniref:Glycosyltransferase involved in cell wall biosynthesis/GT2 family glycosyltransferase n=1 Tax=Allostreptomyces psammosilenae TaxID=1892865 RepID=A0A853AA09_9ACTN|nr:glycosyltransferase [Allostreptomyces psammosilenae]NYI07461.1 glycosyltransferase involved in cell wall biosynthesis/GT2 family glycosyltransferase [Allostreptomyces psammosilenae]